MTGERRMLKKEAHHFLCGVGAFRIGKRAAGTASRPRVTCAVHQPLLGGRVSTRIAGNGTSVGMAADDLAALYGSPAIALSLSARPAANQNRSRLRDHLLAV